jgi:hypothetical protein
MRKSLRCKDSRPPLVRAYGKRRYQAFSDGSTWGQLGTGLEAMQLSPYHAGLADLRLSAPFLRIPLFRHALFPSAFRRQVRLLTSGTFPRFPDHLSGDMKLVVTAHAEAVRRRLQTLVRRCLYVTCLVACASSMGHGDDLLSLPRFLYLTISPQLLQRCWGS